MSPLSWSANLSQTLSRLASCAGPGPLRVAVVGVGQSLRGDDGAGGEIARRLQARLQGVSSVLVLDGGCAPENQTGPLRGHRPALVILVDAAQMGAAPGTLAWLGWEETRGMTASTHTLPLHLLARYLSNVLSCQVFLLGIEPADTTIGAPLSPAVAEAVEAATAGLAKALRPLSIKEIEHAPVIGH
jgi:hydrogenase 3 maturation protease